MKRDPLIGWKAFLASPIAPATAMQPVELEGYLTGLVVVPDRVPMDRWFSGLWGPGESVVFDSTEHLQSTIDSVMEHYNAVIDEIDHKGAKWKPMFFGARGEVNIDQCSRWVHGFWKAMMFAPEAWLELGDDEQTRMLVEPFAVFLHSEETGGQPGTYKTRREMAEHIPRALPALRKLAQMRAGEEISTERKSHKVGRNDQCPCGSGKKFKRCCGLN